MKLSTTSIIGLLITIIIILLVLLQQTQVSAPTTDDVVKEETQTEETALPPTQVCSEAVTAPTITSISPNALAVGDTITVQGCNFPGFEGDLTAWVVTPTSEQLFISSDPGSTDTVMTFTLPASLCTVDTSYSGDPCPQTVLLAPGAYQLYTAPWGNQSNSVSFTIQ